MLYQRPSFTCPTSNNVSQKRWDLAFLSKAEFLGKYYFITEAEYDKLLRGKV